MRILIVEDSPADRELLRSNLEDQRGLEFIEADNLTKARAVLKCGGIDCVLLDLQLPDSVGKETFERLIERFPDIPIIVMTNNTDRELALGMIKNGAADFLIKDYTDGERLYRRILFAIEKHQRSVRVRPEAAQLVHRLERSKASMLTAHQSGEHLAVMESAPPTCPVHQKTMESIGILTEVSRDMFVELQAMRADMRKSDTAQNQDSDTVEQLKTIVLEGTPDRPSLMSGVEQLRRAQTLRPAAKAKSGINTLAKLLLALLILALLAVAGTKILGGYNNHTHDEHHKLS